MTYYRELQQWLKPYKERGLTTVKLNSKTEVLQAEYERLTSESKPIAQPAKSHRTIGVEIEFKYPAIYRTGYLYRLLKEAGVDLIDNMTTFDLGANPVTTGKYVLKHDRSLGSGAEWSGAELVSPPLDLSNPDHMKGLREVYKVLKSINCKVDYQCSTHVHIDAKDLTVAQIMRYSVEWAKHEDEFNKYISPMRRDSYFRFASSVQGKYTEEKLKRATIAYASEPTMVSIISYALLSRHYKLNLHAYSKYRTVEIRSMGGSLNFNRVVKWATLQRDFLEQTLR